MKKISTILINAFCILFLNTCYQPAFGKGQKFKGDYSTETVRTMWFVCNRTIAMQIPHAPAMYTVKVCDCVLDTMRKEISFDDFMSRQAPEREEIVFRATSQCIMKVEGTEPV